MAYLKAVIVIYTLGVYYSTLFIDCNLFQKGWFVYLPNLRGIGPEELEFFHDQVLPIHHYGKFGLRFLTMWTRRCLWRYWRHDRNFAYSHNAKIANVESLETYTSNNLSLPALNNPYTLVFWKRLTQSFDIPNLGKINQGEPKLRGNQMSPMLDFLFANAKFPIQTVLVAKIQLPITRLYFTI